MAKKFWMTAASDGDTCGHYQTKYETREQAIAAASEMAADNECNYLVVEVIASVKPERAPVTVTTL
jgi:hypothetical protein